MSDYFDKDAEHITDITHLDDHFHVAQSIPTKTGGLYYSYCAFFDSLKDFDLHVKRIIAAWEKDHKKLNMLPERDYNFIFKQPHKPKPIKKLESQCWVEWLPDKAAFQVIENVHFATQIQGEPLTKEMIEKIDLTSMLRACQSSSFPIEDIQDKKQKLRNDCIISHEWYMVYNMLFDNLDVFIKLMTEIREKIVEHSRVH